MTLSVPHKKQTEEFDCSLAALQMALAYYGDEVSLEEIKKSAAEYVNLDEVHIQGVALYALSRGYKVTLWHHDPLVVDSKIEGIKSAKVLSEKRKELIESGKIEEDSYVSKKLSLDALFMEKGGSYSNVVPTIEKVDTFLNKKIPIITCVSNKILRTEPFLSGNHYVVIVGEEKDGYVFLDPSPNRKKEDVVDKAKFTMAWHACGAYTVIIENV